MFWKALKGCMVVAVVILVIIVDVIVAVIKMPPFLMDCG